MVSYSVKLKGNLSRIQKKNWNGGIVFISNLQLGKKN